ncbi:hypothetical protein OIDMADRAFT_60979 [Oidiodendron maius Zn]|uniref:Uncharacterized protein n=1 Tax=Oidiodendron maius (strain Zn) TaxID=913774 RepID=A0A0C3GV31_OIDMZ|nr:hypothetical protein OIDMADRAFT_60979 [Oidiodendron maius Zn]
MKTVLPFSLFIISYLTRQAQAVVVSDCHLYPGAVASDCLTLIGNHFNNDTSFGADSNVILTLGGCSIVTKATAGGNVQTNYDTVVRGALTTIGACAFHDVGSISGAYTSDDGVKTCYLYPGQYGGRMLMIAPLIRFGTDALPVAELTGMPIRYWLFETSVQHAAYEFRTLGSRDSIQFDVVFYPLTSYLKKCIALP